MTPFSRRVLPAPYLMGPSGPTGSGILTSLASGFAFSSGGRYSLTSVWAFVPITKDLPDTSFWIARSSVWVKLSGSSSFSFTSVWRYSSICRYCSMAPVKANFWMLGSHTTPSP